MIPIERYIWLAAFVGIFAGIIIGLSLDGCTRKSGTLPERPLAGATITDTVREPYAIHDTVTVIKPEIRYRPSKVTWYQYPDTARRKAMERDTLVSGITITGTDLQVQTIDTAGISKVSDYTLPANLGLDVTIDRKGNLEIVPDAKEARKKKRRERWRKIGNWALVVGAGLLGHGIK